MELLDTKELARRLDLKEQRLKEDRLQGRGFPYLRIGRTIRYDMDAVRRYLDGCVVEPKQ